MANLIDASPVHHRTQDNRLFTIALPKGQPGEAWQRVFRGDSDGVRNMQPPYQIAGTSLSPHPILLEAFSLYVTVPGS